MQANSWPIKGTKVMMRLMRAGNLWWVGLASVVCHFPSGQPVIDRSGGLKYPLFLPCHDDVSPPRPM